MASSSGGKTELWDYLMNLVEEDKESTPEEEQFMDSYCKKLLKLDEDSDVSEDDFEDIIDEKILQQKIKELESSGGESDDLEDIVGSGKKDSDLEESGEGQRLLNSALQKNRKLKRLLLELEWSLVASLKRISKPNLPKPTEQKKTKEGDLYTKFFSPYFRDGNFPCPKNPDQILKERINKDLIEDPLTVDEWDVTDLNHLEEAIRDCLIDEFLSLNEVNNTSKEKSEKQRIMKTVHDLRTDDLASIFKDMDEDSVDWEAVCLKLRGKHSIQDCKAIWNVYLKPSINKGPWTKVEVDTLLKVAKEENCKNWTKIASKLGTGRSGYICFLLYQRKLSKVSYNWTHEEFSLFKNIVKACKTGDHISWPKVMYYYDCCDFSTMYNKYYKSFDKDDKEIKKGNFEPEEDKLIMEAVEEKGLTLTSVAKILPSRNPVQIRERYNILYSEGKIGQWTKEEDEKLRRLVEEHGIKNWGEISKHLPGRTRTQIRHHCNYITNTIKNSPGCDWSNYRKHVPASSKKKPMKLPQPILTTQEESPDIHEENLIKYFSEARGILKTSKPDISTFENNRERILALSRLLGTSFPSCSSQIKMDLKLYNNFSSGAVQFLKSHLKDLQESSHDQQPEFLFPPNLIAVNSLNNILKKLNQEKDEFESIDSSDSQESLAFSDTAANWYKRIFKIFGSSMFLQDIDVEEYQNLVPCLHLPEKSD